MNRHTTVALCCVVATCASACFDDIILPPDPPTLSLVTNVVRIKRPTLTGTKTPGTEVLCGASDDAGAAVVIVPVDDQAAWSAVTCFDLLPFENNAVFLWTRSKRAGLSYDFLRAALDYQPLFPDAPTLDGGPAIFSNVQPVALAGTKPPKTAIAIDGDIVVPLDGESDWSFALPFTVDEVRRLAITAVDQKDQASEPLDVTVSYDTVAPAIDDARVFPAATLAPNGVLSVPFTEELVIAGALDDVVSVLDGLTPVAALQPQSYEPATHVLRIRPPAAGWPATTLTFRINGTLIADRAGNTRVLAPLQRTVAGVADATVPAAPVVTSVVPETVEDSVLVLSGTKDANTSISIDGVERDALSSSTSWSALVPLAVGPQTLRIVARSAAELDSPEAQVTVTRVQPKPAPPALSPAPPTSTDAPVLALTGTREANTSLVLDDAANVVVPRGPDTAFEMALELVPGRNVRNLFAKRVFDDGSVALSDPTPIDVTLRQAYAGEVSPTSSLEISFTLRNLDAVAPVRSEFSEGTHYGVDAWLEGPLDEGESCRLVGGDRQDIKYADTIIRYKGTKSPHIVPWADDDYRSPDFLAALITGGVLQSADPSLAPSIDRRQDDGKPNAGLNPGAAISEAELDGIDGLSRSTVLPGETLLATWTQEASRRPPLAQGDYLLHIVLNLDRGGTFLSNNDVETCWGSSADAGRGMHRLTIPVSLGDVAYEVPAVGAASELSGADPEAGADRLTFLASTVRVVWRP